MQSRTVELKIAHYTAFYDDDNDFVVIIDAEIMKLP